MTQTPLQREFLELYLCMLRMNKTLGKRLGPEPASLTPLQINALIALSQKTPQSMSELAELLMVQRQQITHLVDTLVRNGLVTRSGSLENRRLVLAELTAQGRAVVERLGDTFSQSLPTDQKHVLKLRRAIATVNNLMTKTA